MQLKSTKSKFGVCSLTIHWLNTLLVIIIILSGLLLTFVPFFRDPFQYHLHTGFGLMILTLTIIRIIWYFIDTKPSLPDGIEGLHAKLYDWNHSGLYILMILMSISGAVILFTTDLKNFLFDDAPTTTYFDMPVTFIHDIIGYILIIFVGVHIVGVFYYQFFKSKILIRMGVKFPGKG